MHPQDISQVIDPDTWQRIEQNISELISRRQALQARIEELTAAGCIHGNIVDEFRNVTTKKRVSGPYYRLTFYKDPKTGHKPKPKYLGKNLERVKKVQSQIDNYQLREEYRAELHKIDLTLMSVSARIEGLDHYLRFETGQLEQLELVIPNPGGPSPDVTK